MPHSQLSMYSEFSHLLAGDQDDDSLLYHPRQPPRLSQSAFPLSISRMLWEGKARLWIINTDVNLLLGSRALVSEHQFFWLLI